MSYFLIADNRLTACTPARVESCSKEDGKISKIRRSYSGYQHQTALWNMGTTNIARLAYKYTYGWIFYLRLALIGFKFTVKHSSSPTAFFDMTSISLLFWYALIRRSISQLHAANREDTSMFRFDILFAWRKSDSDAIGAAVRLRSCSSNLLIVPHSNRTKMTKNRKYRSISSCSTVFTAQIWFESPSRNVALACVNYLKALNCSLGVG